MGTPQVVLKHFLTVFHVIFLSFLLRVLTVPGWCEDLQDTAGARHPSVVHVLKFARYASEVRESFKVLDPDAVPPTVIKPNDVLNRLAQGDRWQLLALRLCGETFPLTTSPLMVSLGN